MPFRPPVHDPRAGRIKTPVHKPKPDNVRQTRRWLATYSAQWRAIRKAQLERFPLCAHCGEPANEVDHIEGDTSKNLIGVDLQSLCKPCHSRKTAGGTLKGCNVLGMPIDPNHRWNREKSPARFDPEHGRQVSRTRPRIGRP